MDVMRRKLIDAWSIMTLSKSELDKEISEMMEDANVPLVLRDDVAIKVAERTIEVLSQ